jgi:hypothetical protein
MPRRLFRLLIALSAVPILCSCTTDKPVKTSGPPATPNSNAAESAPSPDTWSSATLEDWIEERKEMLRAWKNFERSHKYRPALPGETKKRPFMIWWGAEAYQGDEFLIAIVIDPSRTDPNRYGLVVVGAPQSAGRKYKAYWVTREENMENCEISGASGSVFFRCSRENGNEEVRTLAWYRSRSEFRLKPLPVRPT